MQNGFGFVSHHYHFPGSPFYWEMQPCLQQEWFPWGLLFRIRCFFLSGSLFRFNLKFIYSDSAFIEKCLMGSDSGKGRLMKTGERRASGILTFTLVIFLLVFWIFSYNHTLYQMLLFFFENYWMLLHQLNQSL